MPVVSFWVFLALIGMGLILRVYQWRYGTHAWVRWASGLLTLVFIGLLFGPMVGRLFFGWR
jgi:hypothetical protein